MTERWSRLAPLSGVLFVILVVGSVVLSPRFPDSTATGATVVLFYKSHDTQTQVADYLTAIAIFVGFFFFGSLRSYLRRVPAMEPLASVAFGGAVMFAIGAGVSTGFHSALADVPSQLDPSSAQALNLLQINAFQFAEAPGLAVLLVANGLVIVRSGLLPVWLGWVGIVFGAFALTPFAFICQIALGIWILVISPLIYVRSVRVDSAATAHTRHQA